MQSAKVNPVIRKEFIGHNADDDGPKNDQEQSFSKRLPFDLIAVSKRESSTNSKEKQEDNQAREKIPEWMMNNIECDNSKIVEVKREVKDDHEDNSEASENIEKN